MDLWKIDSPWVFSRGICVIASICSSKGWQALSIWDMDPFIGRLGGLYNIDIRRNFWCGDWNWRMCFFYFFRGICTIVWIFSKGWQHPIWDMDPFIGRLGGLYN